MSTTPSHDLALGPGDPPAIGRATIVAGGVYFPSYGITVRRRRRLVSGSDEDAVTMAIDAAERALSAWGGDRGAVDGLFVAVSHGPEVEGTLTQVVREALGLRPDTRVVSFAAEALAGVAALQAALAAVEIGTVNTAMVVASEAGNAAAVPRGAAAVAVIVNQSGAGGLGTQVVEVARMSSLTHDQLRSSPGMPFEADGRFLEHRYTELAGRALGALASDELDAVLFAGGPSSAREQLRREHTLPSSGAIDVTQGGDWGVAGPLLAAVESSARSPSSRVGLIAHGSGQIVVLALSTPAHATGAFGWHDPPEDLAPAVTLADQGPALSLPVESPFFARSWGETLRLEAAACVGCGHVAYPPSQRTICPRCGSRGWEMRALARTGTVLSQIENRFMPTGFADSVVYVLVELDDGYRYFAPTPAEVRGSEVEIGQRVALRLRRFTIRDGVPVYGMKCVPVRDIEVARGRDQATGAC